MRKAGLPVSAQLLGYAGLIPQFVALMVTIAFAPLAPVMAMLGWAYAGLIFSFLGGAWWSFALLDARAPQWVLPLSVLPSLIAFATAALIILAAQPPALPLLMIGIGLLVSPLVDARIAKFAALPAGWLRLRWHLSIGLGLPTLALALAA